MQQKYLYCVAVIRLSDTGVYLKRNMLLVLSPFCSGASEVYNECEYQSLSILTTHYQEKQIK